MEDKNIEEIENELLQACWSPNDYYKNLSKKQECNCNTFIIYSKPEDKTFMVNAVAELNKIQCGLKPAPWRKK